MSLRVNRWLLAAAVLLCAVATASCSTAKKRGISVAKCVVDPPSIGAECYNRDGPFQLSLDEMNNYVCYHPREHEQLMHFCQGTKP